MLYIHVEKEKNYADRFCAALLTLVILRDLKCILRERAEEKLNPLRKSEIYFPIQQLHLQLLTFQSITDQENAFSIHKILPKFTQPKHTPRHCPEEG